MNFPKELVLGDVIILSQEGEVLAKRVYENGEMKYFNQKGHQQKGMIKESYGVETILPPIINGKPNKIQIKSYFMSEELERVNVTVEELFNNRGNKIGEVYIKESSIDRNICTVEFETEDKTLMELYGDNQIIEPEMAASHQIDEEDNKINIKNIFKYNIKRSQKLEMKFRRYKKNDVNIELKVE